MTCRIFKYTLEKFGSHSLPVPLDATFLSVQLQGAAIVLWFAVNDEDMAATGRTFLGVVTGGEVPDGCEYLGTVQLPGGAFVVHIFEDLS